jgi:hypothetical protein
MVNETGGPDTNIVIFSVPGGASVLERWDE